MLDEVLRLLFVPCKMFGQACKSGLSYGCLACLSFIECLASAKLDSPGGGYVLNLTTTHGQLYRLKIASQRPPMMLCVMVDVHQHD